MKKKKLVLMLLMLVIGGLFFTSCSKDKDSVEDNNTLNGTIWEGELERDHNNFFGDVAINDTKTGRTYLRYMKIQFYNNDCTINARFDVYEVQGPGALFGPISRFKSESTFKYSYKYPLYTLTPKSKDNKIEVYQYDYKISLKEGETLYKALTVTLFDNEMSILNTISNEVFKLKRIH